MPLYRTANNTYAIQLTGYGGTGAQVNSSGHVDSSGQFGSPDVPLLLDYARIVVSVEDERWIQGDTIAQAIVNTGAGTVAIVAPAPIGSASQSIDADAGPALGGIAPSGSASVRYTASGSVTLSPTTPIGAASERYSSSGALALPSMVLSAAGSERFNATSAPAISAPGVSGAASEALSAQGNIVTSITPSAAGSERYTASGAASINAPSTSGAASEIFTGNAAIALPAVMPSAVSAEAFIAVALLELRIAIDAMSSEALAASADLALPSISANGGASEGFEAHADVTFPGLFSTGQASAAGAGLSSSALVALNIIGIDATASEAFAAYGSIEIGPMIPVGSNLDTHDGAASIELSIQVSGFASMGFHAFADVAVDGFQPVGFSTYVSLPEFDPMASAPASLRFLIVRSMTELRSSLPIYPEGATAIVTGAGGCHLSFTSRPCGQPLIPDGTNTFSVAGGLWIRMPQRGSGQLVNGSVTVSGYVAGGGQDPTRAQVLAVVTEPQDLGRWTVTKNDNSFTIVSDDPNDNSKFDYILWRSCTD